MNYSRYLQSDLRINLIHAITFTKAARTLCDRAGDEFWRDLLTRSVGDMEHILEECSKPQKTEEELRAEEETA